MQHRRIMWNDNLGLLESLNETDLYTDHGIRVNARYYLEIATQSTSNVRSQQVNIDQPLQVFYSTNFTTGQFKQATFPLPVSDQLTSIKLMPVAKNSIMVRLENFYNEERSIDLQLYASNLYESINGGAEAKQIKIIEVNLAGNVAANGTML